MKKLFYIVCYAMSEMLLSDERKRDENMKLYVYGISTGCTRSQDVPFLTFTYSKELRMILSSCKKKPDTPTLEVTYCEKDV